MDRKKLTRCLIAAFILAFVLMTGIFLGRNSGTVNFSVATEYALGAVSGEEVDALRIAQTSRQQEQLPSGPQPTSTPDATPTGGDEEQPFEVDGRININTADLITLQQLPGVGPAIAGRIIAFREEHGDFLTIYHITEVSGIGPVRFDQIRNLITVS